MKNIKKLSKSAIILYFVELVLAFAIIGLRFQQYQQLVLKDIKTEKI